MIGLLFFAIAAMYVFASVYFVNRFRLEKVAVSLALAAALPGWAVCVARELHLLPRWAMDWLIPCASCAGLLLMLCILGVETQNPKGPFK